MDSGYRKELGDAGAPRARKELRVTTCSEANIDVAWDDPWAQRRGRGSAGRRPERERLRWEREDAEQKAGEGFPAPRFVTFLRRNCGRRRGISLALEGPLAAHVGMDPVDARVD